MDIYSFATLMFEVFILANLQYYWHDKLKEPDYSIPKRCTSIFDLFCRHYQRMGLQRQEALLHLNNDSINALVSKGLNVDPNSRCTLHEIITTMDDTTVQETGSPTPTGYQPLPTYDAAAPQVDEHKKTMSNIFDEINTSLLQCKTYLGFVPRGVYKIATANPCPNTQAAAENKATELYEIAAGR
ncbi:MAG: hypothetical protein LRY43_03775, partial [Gammaproteobacteria bacterium]|nr:hypothetical protein [Gammaproteobacteria bacterium]